MWGIGREKAREGQGNARDEGLELFQLPRECLDTKVGCCRWVVCGGKQVCGCGGWKLKGRMSFNGFTGRMDAEARKKRTSRLKLFFFTRYYYVLPITVHL